MVQIYQYCIKKYLRNVCDHSDNSIMKVEEGSVLSRCTYHLYHFTRSLTLKKYINLIDNHQCYPAKLDYSHANKVDNNSIEMMQLFTRKWLLLMNNSNLTFWQFFHPFPHRIRKLAFFKHRKLSRRIILFSGETPMSTTL